VAPGLHTPAQHVRARTDRRDTGNGLSGVPPGTKNSLVVKLNNALAALNAGDTAAACANLKAFINENAQKSKKKLTAAQADALIVDNAATACAVATDDTAFTA
jgi:hypothetical protein